MGSKATLSPYERLYGKPLPSEKVAEMRFNLLGFFKTLIEMDRQHEEWKKKTTSKLIKNDRK